MSEPKFLYVVTQQREATDRHQPIEHFGEGVPMVVGHRTRAGAEAVVAARVEAAESVGSDNVTAAQLLNLKIQRWENNGEMIVVE